METKILINIEIRCQRTSVLNILWNVRRTVSINRQSFVGIALNRKRRSTVRRVSGQKKKAIRHISLKLSRPSLERRTARSPADDTDTSGDYRGPPPCRDAPTRPARNVATALWLSSPRSNRSPLPSLRPVPLFCPATQPVPRPVVQPALRSWRPSPPPPREITPPLRRHPSSCPRLGLHFSLPSPTVPHRRRPCRLSRGIPTTRLPPLNFPAGTRGRFLRRRGAARRVRAASPRRDERAKPAQKVPFGRKTSLFLSLTLYPIAPPILSSLSLFLSLSLHPSPRDFSSSTSAGSFSLRSEIPLASLLPFLLLLSRIFFFRAFCHSVSVRPVAGTNNATWSRCKNKGRVTGEKALWAGDEREKEGLVAMRATWLLVTACVS